MFRCGCSYGLCQDPARHLGLSVPPHSKEAKAKLSNIYYVPGHHKSPFPPGSWQRALGRAGDGCQSSPVTTASQGIS